MKKFFSILSLLLCLSILSTGFIYADGGIIDDADYVESADVEDNPSPNNDEKLNNTVDIADTESNTREESSVEKYIYKNQYKLDLLNALGIVKSLKFDEKANITRQEFIGIASKFIPGGVSITKYMGYFEDVPETNQYAKTIEAFAELGIISGIGGGKFYPSQTISLNESVKILLDIAGYNSLAMIDGGYPAGYMKIAYAEKLLSAVSASNQLSADAMVNLLYNFLDLPWNEISGIESGNIVLNLKDAKTVMEKVFDTYHIRGIVTANYLTALDSGNTNLQDGYVEIQGDSIYRISVGNTNIADCLGMYLDIYCREIAEDDYVCINYSQNKKNSVVEIALRDIESISKTEMKYEEENKTNRLNYTEDVSIIYNGVYYDKALDISIFGDLIGTITAIDNNGDSEYECLSVKAYESFVVGSIYENGFAEKNNSANFISVDENEYENIDFKFAGGGHAIFQDLKNNSVVSVLASPDDAIKKTMEVIISEQKVSGIVTTVQRGEDFYITIDNIQNYYVIASVNKDSVSPGMGLTAFIDAFDNIVMFDFSNIGEFRYGMAIEWGLDNSVNKTMMLKAYILTGEIQTLTFSEKVIIDGISCKNSEDMKLAFDNVKRVSISSYTLPAGVFPIRIKLNSKGLVSEVDTPETNGDESKNSLTPISNGKYNVFTGNVLGGEVALKSSTSVLKLSCNNIENIESWKDNSNYLSTNSKAFSIGNRYIAAAYKITEDSSYADFVITFASYSNSHTDFFMIVDNVSRSLNSRTDTLTYKIRCVTEGRNKSILVAESYLETFEKLNIRTGDVLRFKLDSNGELAYIENPSSSSGPLAAIKYNNGSVTINNIASGPTSLANIKGAASPSSVALINGYVYEKDNNFLTLSYLPISTTLTQRYVNSDFINAELYKATITSDVQIVVYDPSSSKNKVRIGTLDDIIDFKSDMLNYSRVLLRYRSSALKEVIIFNDATLFN